MIGRPGVIHYLPVKVRSGIFKFKSFEILFKNQLVILYYEDVMDCVATCGFQVVHHLFNGARGHSHTFQRCCLESVGKFLRDGYLYPSGFGTVAFLQEEVSEIPVNATRMKVRVVKKITDESFVVFIFWPFSLHIRLSKGKIP